MSKQVVRLLPRKHDSNLLVQAEIVSSLLVRSILSRQNPSECTVETSSPQFSNRLCMGVGMIQHDSAVSA